MSLIRKNRSKLLASLGVVGATFSANSVIAQAEETTGHIDVYVETQGLEDAISYAESAGVTVNREATTIQTGNAAEVAKYTSDAKAYYASKATELRDAADKYRADLAKYEQDVAKAQTDADNANGKIDGYETTLAALGLSTKTVAKTYSAAELASASQAIEAAIAKSKTYHQVDDAITAFNTAQNAMTNFQTQDAQGTITIKRQTVKVSTVAEVEQYKAQVQRAYEQMNAYVNGLGSNPGAVTNKPTYTLYDIVMTDAMVAEQAKVVEVPFFSPVTVARVEVPQVSYKFFDIRQVSDIDNGINNKDSEEIVAKPSTNGEVHQAMVNQTIKVTTVTDPLPAGRFDKFHSVVFTYTVPAGAEVVDQVYNKEHYTVEYDEARGLLTFRATDDYLLEMNTAQAVREGENAGYINSKFELDVPAASFKLLNDATTYTFNASVLVNHEHKVRSDDIVVRTDSADPNKTNKTEDGTVIDGKATWANDVNNYTLTWDFDQYKGVNIDREMQSKGIILYDFYPANAVDYIGPAVIKHKGVVIATEQADGTFVDANGAVIAGLTLEQVTSVEGIEETGPAIAVGFKGYDHPWYKKYVEGGEKLEVVLPMRTKLIDSTPNVDGGYYGGIEYKNVFYQSDFGNIYKSNEVLNSIVRVDPRKDAVASISNLTSLDLKNNPTAVIAQGDYFQYRGQGTTIPKNATAAKSYAIADTFHAADDYQGVYFVEANGIIKFKAGTEYAERYAKGMLANSEITKYTTQTITRNVTTGVNTATGTVSGADEKVTKVLVTFDEDFWNAIDFANSDFQMDIFFQAKRAQNVQGVTNVFEEIINGVSYGSTKVTTNSEKSAVDKLREQLEILTGRVEKDEKDLSDFKTETVSNLSVIRRDLTAVSNKVDTAEKTATEDKVAQNAVNKALAEGVLSNAEAIKANEEAIKTNATNIASNKSEILSVRTLLGQLVNVVKDIDGQVNENTTAISDLSAKTKQRLSTLTIYVPSVTTDAEAIAYAVNHGVAAGSIKSVTLNDTKHFVVTYNTAEKAINGSQQATQTATNVKAVAKLVTKIDFYTVKSKEEAIEAAKKLGHDESSITTVTEKNGVYTVVIDTRLKTTEEKAVNVVASTSVATTVPESSENAITLASTDVFIKKLTR